jgi:hypothetical protein
VKRKRRREEGGREEGGREEGGREEGGREEPKYFPFLVKKILLEALSKPTPMTSPVPKVLPYASPIPPGRPVFQM